MIIDKINFPIYGILVFLSISVGGLYVVLNLRKKVNNIAYLFYFMLLYTVFALFGSIIISYIINGKIGFNSYAGAISLIICSFIFNKIAPLNNEYMKYSIISLPLIYAIGKIGCFFVGCCYGIPYNGILSVTYTDGLNIPLFPIQITEAIVFLIIFLILNHFKNNKNITYITVITCAFIKFFLDYLRYDHVTKLITRNQIISIAFILIAIILLIKRNLKK